MTPRPITTWIWRATVALTVATLATLGLSSAASAHTDFVASNPDDGETVEGPLANVVITFTNPAVEAGDGFELLKPDGTILEPSSVDATDGTEFIAIFEPALTDGTYGFRWQVQAGDAHPIDGSFRFTVTGAPATTAPPTTAVTGTVPEAAVPTTTPTTVPGNAVALDEFLDDDDRPGPWLGRAGRILTIGGTVFTAGVTAALAWVIRGRRDELDHLLAWIRVAGVALVAGGITEMGALLEAPATSLRDTATTKPGVAALLTLVGGVLVVIGLGPGAGRLVGSPRSLSAAVTVDDRSTMRDGSALTVDDTTTSRGSALTVDDTTTSRGSALTVDDTTTSRGSALTVDDAVAPIERGDGSAPLGQRPPRPRSGLRWVPDTTAFVGLTGIAVAIAAYWFDGHTVSRGPWIAHTAVNLVHVAAASAWAGGVFAVGAVAALRRRRRSDTGLAPMIVRFSSIAAASLAALTVAGVVMTWLVIDAPSDVWTTDWGRVLLAKIAVVGVAAALGGYNHFRLRPHLEARPDDPGLAHHLRISLLTESILLVAVVVLTSILVAAST